MSSPSIWLAVAAGGAIGAMARHAVSRASLHWLGPNFPWGTLAANITGSFLMGVFIVWLAAREPHSAVLRSFLTVGVLGAFTTFSTFALDVVVLFERKAYLAAGGYLAASVLLSVFGLVLGMMAMRALT